MLKALLIALLEPTAELKKAELDMDYTKRLALMEELKTLPWAAVWEAYCARKGVPAGMAWFDEIRVYEKAVLAKR